MRKPRTPKQTISQIAKAFEVESSEASAFIGATEGADADDNPNALIPQGEVSTAFNKTEEATLDRFNQETKHAGDMHDWRKEYISKTFLLVAWWLIFVGFIVFMIAIERFHLTDGVLIALITTTTASVIGIFLIVANWLFPKSPKEP